MTAPPRSGPPAIGDFISLKCLPLAAVICVFAIIWGVNATFIVLIGDDRGIVGISLFFTVNALTLLISRLSRDAAPEHVASRRLLPLGHHRGGGRAAHRLLEPAVADPRLGSV